MKSLQQHLKESSIKSSYTLYTVGKKVKYGDYWQHPITIKEGIKSKAVADKLCKKLNKEESDKNVIYVVEAHGYVSHVR